MLFRMLRDDFSEVAIGFAALATSFGYNLYHYIFAQVDPGIPIPTSIYDIVAKLGGFGIAIWLVIHHTMITIPKMMKEHREERKEALEQFEKALTEKRLDYKKELEDQRKEFGQMLERVSCRYKG
jgi:hypothetical protein